MNEEVEFNNQTDLKKLNKVLENVNWTLLAKEFPEENTTNFEKLDKIERILNVLKKGYSESIEPHEEESIIKIVNKLCQLMRPPNEMTRYDAKEIVPEEDQRAYHLLINMCLQCIKVLMSVFSFLAVHPQANDKITQILATYQIKTDPWTSTKNYDLSLKILETWKVDLMSEKVLERILIDGIRPYFLSHQKESSFTNYMGLQREKIIHGSYENVSKALGELKIEPWKSEKVECVSILEWILFVCQNEMIEKKFFLIIPPLVTLLEDADPNFKLKSVRCLHHLLSKCDSIFLRRTGIGNLFWKLLIQCLSYHPPSIHITISIPLLRTSLNNLIILASLIQPESRSERAKLYDEIVYAGIFNGMLYSGEQPDIAILLMEYTEKLVNVMGIYSVKHIKMLIPLVSSVLENSFQINYPQRFIEATRALTTIIRVCWPRVGLHHATILQGICFCWLNIQLQKGNVIDQLKKELYFCVKALKKVMGLDLDKDLQILMDLDPSLASFFKDI